MLMCLSETRPYPHAMHAHNNSETASDRFDISKLKQCKLVCHKNIHVANRLP